MNCPLSGLPCDKFKNCHITENIDGVESQISLCQTCAQSYLMDEEKELIKPKSNDRMQALNKLVNIVKSKKENEIAAKPAIYNFENYLEDMQQLLLDAVKKGNYEAASLHLEAIRITETLHKKCNQLKIDLYKAIEEKDFEKASAIQKQIQVIVEKMLKN
jgi:protein-arginine kinase activator protein McsA